MSTEVIKKESVKTRIKEPSRYKVIILNDDYTPMDFVIAVLVTVFKHEENRAIKLMMQVHNEGSAVAGIYSHEIAEQKHIEASSIAKEHNFPLQFKLEVE
jgi:ATP-dependent Clp protease adaptor protein ClpS